MLSYSLQSESVSSKPAHSDSCYCYTWERGSKNRFWEHR